MTGENIAIKGKQIATTSIKSYHSEEVKKKIPKQEKLVLDYLSKIKEANSRQIAKALDIERTSITRTIYNLQYKQGLVIITKEDQCPITSRQVRWYALKKNN